MTLQTAQSTASGIIEIPVIRQEVQIPHGGTIGRMPHGGRIPHGTAIGRIPHGTAQEKAARSIGCPIAHEIFADRAYNDDATLVDRSMPGAVIHDPKVAGQRMVDMVKAQAIITDSGKHIETPIDTICLHGDTPTAVQIAAEVRSALEDASITVTQFAGRTA